MADPKVRALQLNIEGLLKLLGGTAAQRARFWEIFKGITTPRETVLINSQVATLAAAAKQLQTGVKQLGNVAQRMG